MPTYQALSDLVTINASLVGTNPQSASFAVPMIAWEFSFAGWGAERARTFSGSRSQALADWVASGGSVGDAVYVAIYQMLSQRNAPSSFVVGRRDPTDPDWGTALDAIYAEDPTWYAFCLAEDRTPAGILEAGNWATTKIALFFPQTDDADVYSQAAGNLAEDLAALVPLVPIGAPRWALTWHDPATASGASAPSVTFAPTNAGLTWDLRDPSGEVTLNMRVDGGAEEIATVAALPATVTGTNAAPFSSANAAHLDVSFDGSVTFFCTIDAGFASTVTGSAETWDLSSVVGTTLEVTTDTGTDDYAFLTAAAPSDPTAVTAAELVADFVAGISGTIASASAAGGLVTFRSITAGTNARFRFTTGTDSDILLLLGLAPQDTQYVGSGNVATVTAITIDEMVAIVSGEIGSAGIAEDNGAGRLRLRGSIYGTSGDVTIANTSTAGLLTVLGLTAGSTAGTGDVPDASQVTPIQLEPILDADYSSDVDVTVDVVTGAITIESLTGVGYWRTLQFTSSMRPILGIPAGIIRGEGVEDDHGGSAAIIGGRLGRNIDADGLINFDWCPLAGVYGDSIPQNRSIALRRYNPASVNTIERRSPTDVRAAFHDGRACGALDTGEPVFIDSVIGIDWLGVRLQEAFVGLFERAASSGTAIPYTDRQARTAILSVLGDELNFAAQRNVIEPVDLTPPTADKPTGVTVALKSELSSALRTIRHWRVDLTLQGAGFLQGLLINLAVGNA